MDKSYWNKLSEKELLDLFGAGLQMKVREKLRSIVSEKAFYGTILECGCGIGIEYNGLGERYQNKYTGIDSCENAVRICCQRYNGKFIVGDIEKLDFANDEFDVVFTKDVLEHLVDCKVGISEMFRVSKKWVIMSFFNGFGDTTEIIKDNRGYYNNRYSDRRINEHCKLNGAKSVEFVSVINGTRCEYIVVCYKGE